MRKLILLLTALWTTFGIEAQTDLIISEYVEGWSNNKALEIYNPTSQPIELSNYRLVRYSNGTDRPPAEQKWTIGLPSGNLAPYKTYVVVIDQRNPTGTGQTAPVWAQLAQRADVFLCPDYTISETMYFNGDDAILIEKKNGANYDIVDLFGRWGSPAPALATVPGTSTKLKCWTDSLPYFSGLGKGITAEHTLLRKSTVKTGVKTNPTIFNPLSEYDSLPANTFSNLGWHKFDGAPANSTPALNNSTATIYVKPSLTNGAEFGTLTATDTENDALKYYIEYGNFVYINNVRKEPFALDKTTGKLTVADATGLVPAERDTFYLDIYVTDGFSQSAKQKVMVVLSENASNQLVETKTEVNIYPNPVVGKQFEISSNVFFNNIEIIDMLGKTVFSLNVKATTGQKVFIPSLEKGIYFIALKQVNETKITKRIVIK